MANNTKRKSVLTRLAAVSALTALALAGCSSDEKPNPTTDPTSSTPAGTFDSGNAEYDAIINGGAVAPDDVIAASKWAAAVKKAGVLKVGATETSNLFSLLDPKSQKVVGFDAGLTQLLARYILGDAKTEVTQVSVDTRESLLETEQVDIVAATYSITPKRLQRIDFAGPYYSSQAGILVRADNTDIKSIADLAGKIVTTQAGSTGVTLLESDAPKAEVLALPDNAQCVAALQQGRADAYAIDQTLLLNNIMGNPGKFKLVGEPFGPQDPYGIGVHKGSDAKEFIDTWLQSILDDGTWLNMWKATIGAKTGTDALPSTPVIGSAGN